MATLTASTTVPAPKSSASHSILRRPISSTVLNFESNLSSCLNHSNSSDELQSSRHQISFFRPLKMELTAAFETMMAYVLGKPKAEMELMEVPVAEVNNFTLFHSSYNPRRIAVINLDPANDALSYECSVNIGDLIKLSDVMWEHSLGPNGGLVYCMDYLEKNIDWLEAKLKPLLKDHYLFFDFPGQVELFFLYFNAKNVIMRLIKKLHLMV